AGGCAEAAVADMMFLLDSRMVPSQEVRGRSSFLDTGRGRSGRRSPAGHAENFETAPFPRWKARRPGMQRVPRGLGSAREQPAPKYPLMIYGNREKWSSIPAGTASRSTAPGSCGRTA